MGGDEGRLTRKGTFELSFDGGLDFSRRQWQRHLRSGNKNKPVKKTMYVVLGIWMISILKTSCKSPGNEESRTVFKKHNDFVKILF